MTEEKEPVIPPTQKAWPTLQYFLGLSAKNGHGIVRIWTHDRQMIRLTFSGAFKRAEQKETEGTAIATNIISGNKISGVS